MWRVLRDGDHGVGLARPLGVSDEPSALAGVASAPEHTLSRLHIVGPEDHLGRLPIYAGEAFRLFLQDVLDS